MSCGLLSNTVFAVAGTSAGERHGGGRLGRGQDLNNFRMVLAIPGDSNQQEFDARALPDSQHFA